ncbi:hypothetical protein H6P81_010873 [Aristolochia fimbriata]|uniref:Uncharacterized protein n=1 Tax=Aristolochia fimbriata TaxID=158543 RepID=A0AAV7EPZ7_ARIFI|nr:hypothetical protein H6P81_010873 [Aristolochia fimbriata]
MACLDTFNMDHQSSFCPSMSPRISFSNDFIDPDQKIIKHERLAAPPPDASSDFEFSVSNYSMIAADEIFFKGRILPLKENCTTKLQKMTLRDELRNDDDGDARPPKGPMRWKELLGLRKTTSHSHVGKKHVDGSSVERKSTLCPTGTHKISQMQEVLMNGGDED